MHEYPPSTIQIYLPSGDPRGIRVAALTMSIVQVIEVPRALLPEFQATETASQVGVYFLVGEDEEGDRSSVYIGQTGGLGKRLNEHHLDRKRGSWTRALVAVSLTKSLTQTHAVYLEWRSILQANQAGRYVVGNGNAGSKPYTPAPMEADCQDFFETLRTLTATLGQPFFGPWTKAAATQEDLFYCKAAAYDAVAEYTEEGMVVLKGSRARVEVAPSMLQMSAGKRRQGLIDDGRLKLEGAAYVFQKDVPFKSPSGASDVVVGASSNGWLMWRSKSGKTLDEVKRVQPTPAGA